MNAIVVANAFPFPLDDGYRVRLFHVLRGIVKSMPTFLVCPAPTDRSVERGLASALSDFGTFQYISNRNSQSQRYLSAALGFVSRTPFHVWDARFAGLRQSLREAVEMSQAHGPAELRIVATSPFVVPLIEQERLRVDVVDFHNVYSHLFEQYASNSRNGARRSYLGMTAIKTRTLEARCATVAGQTWTCSADDAARLVQLTPRTTPIVVPNGTTVAESPLWQPRDGAPLLFFGRLDYAPNVDAVEWLAREIVPQLQRSGCHLPIDIVGAGASDALRGLVESTTGMRFVGRVESIAETIANATAVVVPLRLGGGTRLKVLEALGAGCPTIATSIAVEGIRLRPGVDYLRAETASEFVAAVQTVAADREAAQLLSRNAHATARSSYDWRSIEHQIVTLMSGSPS